MAEQNYADDQQQIETDQSTEAEAGAEQKSADAASEQDTEESDDQDTQGEEGETARSRKRNRPGKLERELERVKAQNDQLMQFVSQFQQNQGNGAQQQQAQQPQEQPKPKYEDFNSDDEYFEALADWKADQKLNQYRQETERQRREREQREAQQTRQQKLTERLEQGRDKYDDFDEVVYDESVPITDTMAEAIAESDVGDEVAYYLGSHPKEAARIAKLSPVAAGREMGRLESKLSQPKQQQQSKAPEPPKRVKGGGETAKKDPSKMSMDEYIKWRNGR